MAQVIDAAALFVTPTTKPSGFEQGMFTFTVWPKVPCDPDDEAFGL